MHFSFFLRKAQNHYLVISINTHIRMFRKLIFIMILGATAQASDLTHDFKNPSFSGNGYSTHVLSIEQLRYSRKNDVKEEQRRLASQAERDAENTTINKFIKNVESRIYANLSKQLVDNMFGESCTGECPTSGTADIEGSTIYWVKDTTTEIITLTVTAEDGSITTMSIPMGDFNF